MSCLLHLLDNNQLAQGRGLICTPDILAGFCLFPLITSAFQTFKPTLHSCFIVLKPQKKTDKMNLNFKLLRNFAMEKEMRTIFLSIKFAMAKKETFCRRFQVENICL